MSGYENFSLCYDNFMDDVNYEEYADLILSICKKYNHSPKLVLDAGCGTGSLTVALANRGLDMIGVDSSEDMLAVAREKGNDSILYLNQDLCDLDLYGTINLTVSALDTLNHITCKKQLKKALKRISLFSEKDSLFIFDVNTIYKHKQILANNTFILEDEGMFLSWQNSLDKDTVTITLDLFVEDDDKYIRYTDEFCERAYSDEEITDMLSYAGFEILEKLDFDTFGKIKNTSEKVIYVARKI